MFSNKGEKLQILINMVFLLIPKLYYWDLKMYTKRTKHKKFVKNKRYHRRLSDIGYNGLRGIRESSKDSWKIEDTLKFF